MLCAFIPISAEKAFFLWDIFDGYKPKNKTGNNPSFKDRKEKKFRNRNWDAQDDSFSSISIRLSKDSLGSRQQFKSRPYLLDWWWFKFPPSWSSKAVDHNLEPQCS